MKKRVIPETFSDEDLDNNTETELDEQGHTLYCKWGQKRRFRIYDPEPLFPFGRPKYKQILLSFFLLFTGILFMFMAYKHSDQSFYNCASYFSMGILLLIPGLYHSHIVVRIMLGHQGYHYDQLAETS